MQVAGRYCSATAARCEEVRTQKACRMLEPTFVCLVIWYDIVVGLSRSENGDDDDDGDDESEERTPLVQVPHAENEEG